MLMLQWNPKRTTLLIVALLCAIAAVLGEFDFGGFINLTW
jgi:hypothetical protein